MPSPKELAKALAYQGEIRNTSRNRLLGGVADVLSPVSEFADQYKISDRIPFLGGMSAADLTGLKGAQSLVNDMSYGKSPISGASLQTTKVDPRVIDLAGVSGAMIPVGKALGKAALREGARQIETGTGIGRAALNPRMSAVPEGASMPQRPKTEFEILHDTAQRNAALPVEQGGLGLPSGNTYMDRANAPGMFPEDAVHFSRAGGDYTTLDSGKYAIAPFDAVGTHVGTPQAAMERFQNTVGYKVNDPNYINDELKGTSYPVRISNSNPLMNQNGMPFGEEDLNTLLRQAGGHNSPDISGGDRELNAKLRKKLFEDQGYTNIPYFNEVEGRGSVSQIVPPSNIRSRWAAFDPFRRHEADLLAGVGVGGMLDPQAIAEALRQQDRK